MGTRRARSPEPVTEQDHIAGRPAGFPIVGLGASAGGLDAYSLFFRNMPADSGLAFVLIQHLDPSHPSLLTEILQRETAMPVVEAQDQMKVLPDHVYVIPPNRDMTLFQGVLQISMPEARSRPRMAIDAFLRSLAEDQHEDAIGVVLSGTGTDGTLGLRAILGAGGVGLVQEPASAKFDGMPVSAIQAGYVTYVLPPERMPHTLLTVALHRPAQQEQAGAAIVRAHPHIVSRLLAMLRSTTGHDFSQYKKTTIGRRIERRMAQHEIADIKLYLRYIEEHPAETRILFKDLLINVTSFFRDPEAYDKLAHEILPPLLAVQPKGYVFRVWVAGCASGEEAYSIAILLRELIDERQSDTKVQIYATDLDEEVIAQARSGRYPPNIAQDVSPERLRRFFIQEDAGYLVKKEIRDTVVFAVQNLIRDPPFTKLDLLACRNLMIYLEPALQNRLVPVFHYALRPGGVLFLSPSETIGDHPELFTALSRKWKLYRAVRSIASARSVMASGLSWAAEPGGDVGTAAPAKTKEADLADLTRRMLLQSFVPASVVTDTQGNIQYVHGETGKYLRPAPGQASLNVVDMAREELGMELRSVLQEAGKGAETVARCDAAVKVGEELQPVRLSARPLPDASGGQGLLLISFEEVGSAPKPAKRGAAGRARRGSRRTEALEAELSYVKKHLQATIEGQQASNEELKSANEELQATNEELQSTNEELETSREELQSVNEELITVNAEFQDKIEQLAGMQNDMKNLLDNIYVGTIFLDTHLLIRRFTREAARAYRLVVTDLGRPLCDIKSNFEGDDLVAEAQTVLETLVPIERELHTEDGSWYLLRIQPYRTLDNVIEGVVLTFTDISARMAAEAAVQAARDLAEAIVDTVYEPLIVLDERLQVTSASRAFYKAFRVEPAQVLGKLLYELGNGQWDIPALRELLEDILPHDQGFEGYLVDHDFPVVGRRRMLLNARQVVGKSGVKPLILLAMEPLPMDHGGA